MSENKDAFYREEFEELDVVVYGHYYDHCGNGSIERVYDVAMEKMYLAGRRKGKEEIDLKNDAMSIMSNKIFELKSTIADKDKAEIDPHSKCMLDEIEYKKEIESLKKELEEKATKNSKLLEDFHKLYSRDIEDETLAENQKLLKLVEMARVIMTAIVPEWRDHRNRWIKEASEVLK